MEPEHAPLDRSVSVKEHDYDLVFLGRPVKQKGWHTFLTMVKQLSCRGLAMIPWQPEGTMPEDLEIRLEATNEEIRDLLGRSKILLLPSDYESFGFAQAEALNQGCCVPVLGEWPLWMDVSELIWKDLPITEWTVRLARLLDDETYLSKLAEAQRLAWKHRPERACSTLPMILSESFRP
jgi:glycosyltransferase involved in cell wall biosynthesis